MHVLILVENLPVPFDRRVWQESRALVDAGYAVTVICPMGAQEHREREETRGRSYPALSPARRQRRPVRLRARVLVRAVAHLQARPPRAPRGAVDVVHACNPPDLLFLVALVAPAGWHTLRLRPPRPGARAVSVTVPRARAIAVLG